MSSAFLAKFYGYRNKLVAIPLFAAIFITWSECEKAPIIWVVGGLIYLLGLTLRIWAQQHLRFRLQTCMTLTRTGPYAYVRNPIYIGNTLICTGITIMSELLWLVPFTIIVCAISYHLTVLHEEKKLSRLYGEEYLRYMDEVPRWIPRLRGKKELDLIVREYFAKSLRAEAYNLLLLIPMLVKELVT